MAERYPTSVEHERHRLGAVVGGGASLEAIAGIAAVTLAVVALAGVLPFYMLTIALIVAGAALLVDGFTVGAAYRELRRARDVPEGKRDLVPVSTGLSAQVLGGAIAVIVGILALTGTFSATGTAITIIVLGTALLVGAMTHEEVDWSPLALHDHSASPRPAFRRTLRIAEFGGGIVVFLGVLSLVAIAGPTGSAPFSLILVALLGIGIVEFLDGSAVLGRIARRPAAPPDIRDHRVTGLP